MHADVSDRIIFHGVRVGDPGRRGVIREIHRTDGQPPYLVDWNDGHEALFFFPAGHATIEPEADTAPAAKA